MRIAIAGNMSPTTWQAEQAQRSDARHMLVAADDRLGDGTTANARTSGGDGPSGPVSEQISLATVWELLISGRSRVVDTFCTERRCYAVLAKSARRQPVRMTKRRIACLERYLLGEQPKVVAEDLRLSRSTVTTDLGDCLDAMGIHRQTSRIPVLLAMAVRASHGDPLVPPGRLTRLSYLGTEHSIVSVERPDLALSNQLSPAEFSVARMLLEGRTHAEIAQLRQTSLRTIANQLAATFQKLGVSGRWQLLCYVLSARKPGDCAAS